MSDKQTSISDNSEYKECCKLFVSDDTEFENFKQHPHYTKILEHATRDQAEECIPLIVNAGVDLERLDILRTNDDQGSPTLEDYTDARFNQISPSTIRYMKIVGDMLDIYSSLDGFDIVEIGVGYGGQCKLLNDYFKINSYDLVDLPEVLELTKKYLDKYDYSDVNAWDQESEKEYDLVISNYAITECDREIQEFYIENIVKKSKHGYITCNYISDRFNINSMSQEEFIEKLEIPSDKLYIIDENPLTFPGNKVLIW